MLMPMRSRTVFLSIVAATGFGLLPACASHRADSESPNAQADRSDSRDAEHRGHHAHHEKADEGGMPHRFEDADAWAKHFENPERDAWQKPDEVVAALELRPTDRVADIGAGTGYFSVRLARAVPEGKVFAVDIEPDMVRYLSERSEREGLDNLVAMRADAGAPELPEPVDVVFSCNVYHHIAERPTYFRQLRDALVPGGRLVIVDFRADARDAPGPPPEYRVAASEAIAELEQAGFELLEVDRERLPFQYMLSFRAR